MAVSGFALPISSAMALNHAIAALDRQAAEGVISGSAARWNRVVRTETLAACLGLPRVSVPRLRVETLRLKCADQGDPQSLSGRGDRHALLLPCSDRMSRNEATAEAVAKREKKITCPLTSDLVQLRRTSGFPAVWS